MYSVEDLLISHGYKPARDLTAPREDDPEGQGRRHRRVRSSAAHGLLNGYEDRPAASEPSTASRGRGHVSDSQSRRSSASGPAEAGFSKRPALAWSSQPQSGHEQACGRRGGPEAGNLQGRKERQELEGRRMAQAHGVPAHVREGPWEVGGRTEDVMKKAVWEEELRMSGPARWQDVSLECWSQPRKLGRQMSDGDREKLFQDLYPFIQGELALSSQNKKKSRSLPRVLSPESLSRMQIPIPLNDGHMPGLPKMPPYPPNCAPHLESTRNPEKGGSSAPFPRPKFGKPIKPLSYSSHQPCRGGESSGVPGSQQPDPHSPCPTKAPHPRHERGLSDSGLEPPGYVPPPSYRSPPQHIPNPYLEDTAPRPVDGGHSEQQPLMEAARAACPPSSGVVGTGNEYGVSPRYPWELPPHPRPVTAREGCVQYIPFDDPRIRHIRLAQPPGFCEEGKPNGQTHGFGPVTAREPVLGEMQRDGALLHPQGAVQPSGSKRGPDSADPSPPWPWGPHLGDGENGGFSDQRDLCVVKGQWADVRGDLQGPAESQLFSPDPQDERTWETRTKLRKFEPGIQTKKTSKKKTSETIFCLVSIPVKSEPHLPATDTNNNDLKQRADTKPGVAGGAALQEQALLSMSSTDLELQALTGSMVGRAELAKHDLGEPEEDRQINDLRLLRLAKHAELRGSGARPGHQYRDQQTQTSFPEESRSPPLLPGAKLGGWINAVPPPTCSGPTASKAHLHPASASSDQNQKSHAPDLKRPASLSPSSSSAFSRTSSSINQAPVPKAGQSQPGVDGQGPGAHPAPKPEVVKGEATAGPCNSQQLFGQFLLKPVSRRPWDLISQLESFNKELQEEEESHQGSSSSEESELDEQQRPERADSRPGAWGARGSSPRAERQPRMSAPEDPGLQSGRVTSQAESRSEGPRAGPLHARPQSPHLSQVGDSRGDPFPSAEGSPVAEKRSLEVVNGMNALAVSPGPVKRTMPSRPSDTKTVSLSYLVDPREPPERPKVISAVGSVQLNQRVTPQVDGGEERDTEVLLSLTDKTRGLSAPDLRSVGLTMGQEQGARESHRDLGEEKAIDIPPSESLQDRAARILGIEVAVESLLRGTRRAGQSQLPQPDASACSPESPRGEPAPSSALSRGPTVTTDAFYGRRKCGWTESPLFVGERTPQASEYPDEDGVLASQATSPEPQPGPVEPQSLEPRDVGAKPPFKSTLFHFIERTPSVASSEKRLRSPSKAIESLQERLASPSRRADPERLMRMKEVSSVSRMRCLSTRGAEATEEAEEAKAVRGQAGQTGGLVSPSSTDRAWRAGHPFPVSKDAISWEENGHQAAQREKKSVDQGFWCPDSYDPSRVERV